MIDDVKKFAPDSCRFDPVFLSALEQDYNRLYPCKKHWEQMTHWLAQKVGSTVEFKEPEPETAVQAEENALEEVEDYAPTEEQPASSGGTFSLKKSVSKANRSSKKSSRKSSWDNSKPVQSSGSWDNSRSVNDYQGSFDFAGLGLGLLMMIGAAIWFVVGYMAGYIYFYPPVLFIIGLFKFIKAFFVKV